MTLIYHYSVTVEITSFKLFIVTMGRSGIIKKKCFFFPSLKHQCSCCFSYSHRFQVFLLSQFWGEKKTYCKSCFAMAKRKTFCKIISFFPFLSLVSDEFTHIISLFHITMTASLKCCIHKQIHQFKLTVQFLLLRWIYKHCCYHIFNGKHFEKFSSLSLSLFHFHRAK